MFASKCENCTLLARVENGTNFREQLDSTKEIKSKVIKWPRNSSPWYINKTNENIFTQTCNKCI